MSVTRDKRNGTWYVQAWYKTYDGKRAHKVKRGFKTKPEALAWERDFYAVQAGDMDMKLVDFLELYKKDMGPRLRLNTWKTKESIITKRILPYLGEKRMNQIAPVDIVRWQNELMALEKPGGAGSPRPTSRLSTTSSARSSTTPRASTASRRTRAAGPSPWARSPPAR